MLPLNTFKVHTLDGHVHVHQGGETPTHFPGMWFYEIKIGRYIQRKTAEQLPYRYYGHCAAWTDQQVKDNIQKAYQEHETRPVTVVWASPAVRLEAEDGTLIQEMDWRNVSTL